LIMAAAFTAVERGCPKYRLHLLSTSGHSELSITYTDVSQFL